MPFLFLSLPMILSECISKSFAQDVLSSSFFSFSTQRSDCTATTVNKRQHGQGWLPKTGYTEEAEQALRLNASHESTLE
jgi:hypothetical protein